MTTNSQKIGNAGAGFNYRKFLSDHGILIGLIAIVAGLSIFTPSFMTSRNVINVLRQVSCIGMATIGVGILIIMGQIDLAIGSTFALSGVVAGLAISTASVHGASSALLAHHDAGFDIFHSRENRRLQPHPGVSLVVHDTGNWSADESMKLVENWLQTGRQIDGIAAMADCQLIGVVTAVENAGRIGNLILTGMDCDQPIMAAIEAGKVDSSIWQDGIGQGENAIRLALDAANGKEVKDYLLPFEVCTKDNIEHYKKLAVTRDALARKYF